MADVYWNGSVSNAWAAAGNWEDFGGAPYGTVPLHGDDVHFLGARLGANRCAVGPTAIVLLTSITADAAYGAVICTVCYANCGMDGRRIATVSCDGKTQVAGGWIDVLTLVAADIDCRTIGACNVTTANITANGRLVGGTIGTANFNGDNGRHYTATTTTTVNAYGDGCRITSGTVGTANIYGDNCMFSLATITTAYCYGENIQVQQWNTIGTLYLHGDVADVSEIAIGQGDITNGPYMCGQFQILYDYETGEVLADLTEIAPFAAGRW